MATPRLFDPETDRHPMPPGHRAESAADPLISGRVTYAVYLTLDFNEGEEPYTENEMADAIVGLWEDPRNPGKGNRQEVTVYTCCEACAGSGVVGERERCDCCRQFESDEDARAAVAAGGFTCKGCGREESACSKDPCPAVVKDRES